MRREANFGNIIAEILRKCRREERGERNDERKRNFGNDIAKKKKTEL